MTLIKSEEDIKSPFLLSYVRGLQKINLAVFGITKVCYTNKERAIKYTWIVERIRECQELF